MQERRCNTKAPRLDFGVVVVVVVVRSGLLQKYDY